MTPNGTFAWWHSYRLVRHERCSMRPLLVTRRPLPSRLPACVFAGGVGFLALAHTVFLGVSEGDASPVLWLLFYVSLHVGIYLSGVVVYVKRVPECLAPGKFDCCPSHAWWHVFVVVAAYTHFYGALTYARWRLTTPCFASLGSS